MTIRLPQPRKLTYRDYLGFPSDRNRHEILDGEHAVSPPPVPHHQLVIVRLIYQLQALVAERGLGLVLPAPCCVELFVDPDLRQVEQWCLDDGSYRLAATETERVRLAGSPGVEIDLMRVW
jgi:hypothetical protein